MNDKDKKNDIIDIDDKGATITSSAHENNQNLPAVISSSSDLTVYSPATGKDSLNTYLKEISKYELLSKEQENALTKALSETGDINIARKLVLHNLRLVVKIAMEYRKAYQNVMDLIQEGNLGLMKAVSMYNPEKGAKLSYYASWWIKSYILKFILDNFRLVKIGTTNEQKKLFYNLLKEKDRLLSMGISPDAKTISENLGVSEKAVVTMDQRLSSEGSEVSLDTPLGEDGGATLIDVLNTGQEENPVESAVETGQSLEILETYLKEFLSTLNDRDRDIFQKRLLEEAPLSLQKIADEYGVSRERVRQIEERLLKKLKVYMSDYLR